MTTPAHTRSTLNQGHSRDAAYWGERGEWLIAAARHRDSDCLSQSNFACMEKALRAIPEPADWPHDTAPVAVERSSHWAVGWVEYLVVHPDAAAHVAAAQSMRDSLEDYPVLDEFDFSEREQEEANSVWRNCYRPAERVRYIRQNRTQFEFRGLADLLRCARGEYFAGYASELIS